MLLSLHRCGAQYTLSLPVKRAIDWVLSEALALLPRETGRFCAALLATGLAVQSPQNTIIFTRSFQDIIV